MSQQLCTLLPHPPCLPYFLYLAKDNEISLDSRSSCSSSDLCHLGLCSFPMRYVHDAWETLSPPSIELLHGSTQSRTRSPTSQLAKHSLQTSYHGPCSQHGPIRVSRVHPSSQSFTRTCGPGMVNTHTPPFLNQCPCTQQLTVQIHSFTTET